jgi:hypothetical protein
MDWEAIFRGSRRRVSTVIIGCEADFWSRKPISKEERLRLIRRLKEYVNLSYDSDATLAEQIGANEEALTGWLAGKAKPTFQSLLKIRDFFRRQSNLLVRTNGPYTLLAPSFAASVIDEAVRDCGFAGLRLGRKGRLA